MPDHELPLSAAGLVVDVEPDANPWTSIAIEPTDRRFTFAVISDRTGGARPGVFERGLACADLLAPSFAIQLGDLIEGYTEDDAVLGDQWAHMDQMLSKLKTPLFHVAGNHDVSNPVMEKVWAQRYGRRYYHFRFNDVLFCVFDTQDPVFDLATTTRLEQGEGGGHDVDALHQLLMKDPVTARRLVGDALDWEGTQPANITTEQLDYFRSALAANADARWTIVCMHMPIWQGEHPAWAAIAEMLGERKYTALAGHVHNYKNVEINGRDHIRLGPTGGLWVLDAPAGNFDQVMFVTMTETGPVVANVLLDGVRDDKGLPVHAVATALVPIG